MFWCGIGRVDGVDVPIGGQGGDAVPAHLIPAVGRHYLKHVEGVCGLLAHPIREGVMVNEEGGVVASGLQAGGLCLRGGVEEAQCDAVEKGRGWRSGDLDGCNWVATEQEMAFLTLKLNRTLDSQLGRPLPPIQALGQWIGAKVS